MTRPAYHGKPQIDGLRTITPVIVCSRVPSGQLPFHVMVSASDTTSDAGNPYTDLSYVWSVAGQPVQYGPEAAFMFREAGEYQVTLTASGRNERGEMVTASTSELRTIDTYYLFRASATGGTFTLTSGDNTTAPIAHNASGAAIVAALDAVGIQASVEFNGCIECKAGLSADLSGLTGCNGTPWLRVELQPVASTAVFVTDTWPRRYFDPSYTGGGSDGSIERPYTAWSDVANWLSRDKQTLNRIACFKRGTTSIMNNAINYSIGNRGVRVMAYGDESLPNPVIRAAGSWVVWQWEQNWTGFIGGDFCFSDITFIRDFEGPMFNSYASNNDNPALPYTAFRDVVWDNCLYEQKTTGNGGFVSIQTTQGRGTGFAGVHVYECSIDMGQASKQAIFCGADKWFSVCRSHIVDGVGNITMDHHIYSDVKGHQLFSGIAFGDGQKNFCLNINANNAAGAVKYCTVDNCTITGTQNGIDLSNSNNDRALPGLLDEVVIQFCVITPGKVGTQKLGLYGHNHNRVTLRHSDVIGCTGGPVKLHDSRVRFEMYGCKIDGGVINVAAPYYSSGNIISGVQPQPPVTPPVDTRAQQVKAASLNLLLALGEFNDLEPTQDEIKKAMGAT